VGGRLRLRGRAAARPQRHEPRRCRLARPRKLKELRAKSAAKTEAQPAAAPALNPEAIWEIIAPHVKAAGLAALAFCAVLAAYLLRRRSQMHRKRSADRHKGPGAHHPARQEPGVAAPISEAPASAAPESVPPGQDTAANTTSVPDQAAQNGAAGPPDATP
jgi:hypothetical protein